MKCVIRHVIFAALLLLTFAAPASAQYMYMDTNGDGVSTTADRMNANGTATIADVWVNTNHNRDGSLAVCNTADGDLGTWNSYVVNLHAEGGTVAYSGMTNQQPSFTIVSTITAQSNTDLTFGRAAGAPEPGGLERMMTLTITGQTGSPSIQIPPFSNVGNDPTSFGTACSGQDFDNTYKLSTDWFDADGLGPAASADAAPIVDSPPTASGNEGTLITFTVTASDPDGDAITNLTAAGLPAGATFTKNAANTSGTFSWTPSFTQAGTYSVTFTASNALSGSDTTNITVNNVDRAPVVVAPATASGAENTLITFTVSASDPDGDAITNLVAAPLPAGATFTKNAANTSRTFSWTPSNTQAGTYSVTFTASNALSGSASTTITVTNVDRAPVVVAPATASGAENTLITFTVTASDPDGDAITNLVAAPLPAGATFTKNAANTSGTFSWTPSFTQAGTYSVTFTASNALSGSASTTITVTNVDRAPVVVAPATASGAEGTLISFTVSASDPDGDAITSLTAAPLPAGATFTANASNTSGTFSWTPSFTQAGTYSVTFTAVQALTGSATTTITVTNVDRAPVVVAPATEIGRA